MQTSLKLKSPRRHCPWHRWGQFAALGLALGVVVLGFPVKAGGFESDVRIDGDVTADARDGGDVTNRIGNGEVYIGGGGVHTEGRAGGRGDTSVGTGGSVSVGDGIYNRNGQQHFGGNSGIGGSTFTGKGATLGIGGNNSSVYVGEDVYVPSGSLSLGGMGQCVAVRNNRCCVDIHWGTCVLNIVPPGKHGCPPGYTYTGGVCRLFYDFGGHRIEGY
jgi:hypothetical protein